MKTFIDTTGTTTDGATTELLRFTMLEDSAIEVKATAVAIGDNNASARFERSALIKRIGAGNAQVVAASATVLINEAGSLTWGIAPAVDGPQVVFNVNGAAGVRVNWSVSMVGHEAIKA